MTALTVFNFKRAALRVLDRDGDPWFVAKDAAEALSYANPRKAVRDHCRSARPIGGERNVPPSGLDPQTAIIPESDLYRLILRSDIPEAEEFQAFVTEEVLPTIRKTGSYGTPCVPLAASRKIGWLSNASILARPGAYQR